MPIFITVNVNALILHKMKTQTQYFEFPQIFCTKKISLNAFVNSHIKADYNSASAKTYSAICTLKKSHIF